MKRTLTAIFDGEVLRPEQPVDLEPKVRYHVTTEDELLHSRVPNEPGILDDLLDLSVDIGIEDLAEQHDHYLYGTPKR